MVKATKIVWGYGDFNEGFIRRSEEKFTFGSKVEFLNFLYDEYVKVAAPNDVFSYDDFGDAIHWQFNSAATSIQIDGFNEAAGQ